MKNYYEEPTQVIFITPEINDELPLCGIAYTDEIICGECGGIIEITDAIILKELSWISFSDELGGDTLLAEKDKFENLVRFAVQKDGTITCLFKNGETWAWKNLTDIIDDE